MWKALARMISFFTFSVAGYRKTIVRHNLQQSFPRHPPQQLQEVEAGFYLHFGELIAETLKGFAIKPHVLSHRFSLKGFQAIQKHLLQGQSVLLISGHYGNWEWLSHMLALATAPFDAWAVYKPLSNPLIDMLMQHCRTHLGLKLCPHDQVPRMLAQMKRWPAVALFVADQTPLDIHHAHWLQFLAQDTPFFHGVDKIARKSGFPVYFAAVRKCGWARYEASFEQLLDVTPTTPRGAITAAFAHKLEALIRSAPQYWLWTHRRWKRSHLKPPHAIEVDKLTPTAPRPDRP